MSARPSVLWLGLGGAVALLVLSRTRRGEITVTELADDPLGFLTVTAQKIGQAVQEFTRWSLPAAGARFAALFAQAEADYGMPPNLLARVAWQESRFRPDIISGATRSSAGALGIMQLVPKWHPGVDPLDPAEAIPYAARYLRGMYDRFGTWELALAAYNAGPGNVDRFGGVPPFSETQAYVRDIARDVLA